MHIDLFIVFQLGITFNFDDIVEKMLPNEVITFSDLDFITDQFGDLHLQEPEPPMKEEEQPPLIYAFLVRLEEVVGAGTLALA